MDSTLATNRIDQVDEELIGDYEEAVMGKIFLTDPEMTFQIISDEIELELRELNEHSE